MKRVHPSDWLGCTLFFVAIVLMCGEYLEGGTAVQLVA